MPTTVYKTEYSTSSAMWPLKENINTLALQGAFSRFSRPLRLNEMYGQTIDIDSQWNQAITYVFPIINNNIYKQYFQLESIDTVKTNIGCVSSYFLLSTHLALKEFITPLPRTPQEVPNENQLELKVVNSFKDIPEVKIISVSKYLEEYQFSIILSNEKADNELLDILMRIELNLHNSFVDRFLSFKYIPNKLISENEIIGPTTKIIFNREDKKDAIPIAA